MDFEAFPDVVRLHVRDGAFSVECRQCERLLAVSAGRLGLDKFCSTKCRYTHWVTNNRARLNAATRKYRKARYERDGRWTDSGPKAGALKRWMIEIKSKPCSDCGGTFPVCCMDFDHRDGSEKSYNVGSMFAHHYSRELIEAEVAKCDLVCANCHRVRTLDRRTGTGGAKVQKRGAA